MEENCVTFKAGGELEGICVGTAPSQQDFIKLEKNVEIIKPRLAVIASPSELEWGNKHAQRSANWVDAAHWVALFGNARSVYQKACPPIPTIEGETWKHMRSLHDAYLACGWEAEEDPVGVLKHIDFGTLESED